MMEGRHPTEVVVEVEAVEGVGRVHLELAEVEAAAVAVEGAA